MVYGYVNRLNGETDDFLRERKAEKIVYGENPKTDLLFLEKGDTIILYGLKSISRSLKEALQFAQFVFDNEIEVICADKEDEKYRDFIDTNTAMGRMIIGMWAAINRLDDEYYGNLQNS